MKSEGSVTDKAGEAEEEEEKELTARFEQPAVAELRQTPKDPRTKAGWNIFSRLLFL